MCPSNKPGAQMWGGEAVSSDIPEMDCPVFIILKIQAMQMHRPFTWGWPFPASKRSSSDSLTRGLSPGSRGALRME